MARYLTTRRIPRSLFSTPAFGRLESPFRSLFEEDDFGEGAEMGWMPPTEVVETDDAIVLTAELPGMQRKDVKIELENDVLRIHGEKRGEHEETRDEDGTYRVSERRYGKFTRTFTLPTSVEAEEIAAELNDGVLTLRLPKTEMARGRTIEIKGG